MLTTPGLSNSCPVLYGLCPYGGWLSALRYIACLCLHLCHLLLGSRKVPLCLFHAYERSTWPRKSRSDTRSFEVFSSSHPLAWSYSALTLLSIFKSFCAWNMPFCVKISVCMPLSPSNCKLWKATSPGILFASPCLLKEATGKGDIEVDWTVYWWNL